jgi:hypothetical protein
MRTAPLRRREATPARKAACRTRIRRTLSLETLESRQLLALAPTDDPLAGMSGQGGVCQCPVCTGVGLEQIAVISDNTVSTSSTTSFASLPQLASNPTARAKLYLDFNGHTQSAWGSYGTVTTPAFDQDGNRSSLTTGELATIREVWARVAEDYAPFNIDVTTIAPGSQANGQVAHVAIGGNWSDWYGSTAGGVAYVGGFVNSMPNVAFVFEDALGNGNPRYLAEAISHEAGHLFGLQHQAVWSGSTLVEGYNSGSGNWAPIMGTGYYAERTTWHRGTTSVGSTSMQDDMAIIAGSANGFGWRADDFGSTQATATPLAAGTSVNIAGHIGNASDVDIWSFTTSGGSVNLQLAGSQYGGNLDAVLELRDASGRTIVMASPTATLGANLTSSVGSGTYYIVARGTGGYGNAGQYTLRGTVPASSAVAKPEISVRLNGAELSDGAAVSLGTTTVGTAISRTFSVTNTGAGTLSLTPLSTSGWPSGISLASNLSTTSLIGGQSATFTIRYSATVAGSTSGTIAIKSNDADEASFELRLSASATASIATSTTPTTTTTSASLVKRIIDNGAAGHSRSSGWTTSTGRGVASDIDQSAKGTGANSSTWSFTTLPSGIYQVYASWTGGSTNATNAPFTLYNGSTPTATIRMNQRVASSGLTADGASWKYLGNVTVTAGRLNVRLSNAADGLVVADAIRIVQSKSLAADVPREPAAADMALLGWLNSRPEDSTGFAPATPPASPWAAAGAPRQQRLQSATPAPARTIGGSSLSEFDRCSPDAIDAWAGDLADVIDWLAPVTGAVGTT